MRRSTTAVAVLAATGVLCAQAGAGSGSGEFAPKRLTISRTSFLGVTPTMTFAQVKAQWGRSPNTGARAGRADGRSLARWGNYFAFGPTAATAYYLGRRAGSRPFRYTVDLAFARETGLELRTTFGDRAGTTVREFRRHWPNARRIPAGYGYVRYVAQSGYRGWRLVFFFSAGELKEAELVTGDYVEACYVRRCRAYPVEQAT